MIKLVLPTLLLGITATALAQNPEEIIVVGVVPAGATLERSKIPYPVQTGSATDLQLMDTLSLSDYLAQSFNSVSLNAAQNNPLQSDLQFRGFTASPLLGLAQGLAVYQNGVRINEPLGDAVNWDLLPQSAIQSLLISGGANPLFGLNSLGGALVVDMKDGFSFTGSQLEVSAGSFGRQQANIEIGGNNGQFAYYANIEYFDEKGWRDYSTSDAINFYGSLGWRSEDSQLNLNYQHGESDLTGNGSSPIELLALRRAAIFTGPDITANDMNMLSMDFSRELGSGMSFSGNAFIRHTDTDSFNGDGSEFMVCEFSSAAGLIGGLEDDDLEEFNLDDDDICAGQFTGSEALEDFLNSTAMMAGEDEEFSIEGFDADELSGTGVLADDAINNLSDRSQTSHGADLQLSLQGNYFGKPGQLILGSAYYYGESDFNSLLELSEIDPVTRLTTGLGTGTFVDDAATEITTSTESFSLYASSTLDLSSSIALTASVRANSTLIELQDQSGRRPELNGEHEYNRINPALGVTWQLNESHNLYANVSQSSRAPTPIELACNESVFDLAVYYAQQRGEDPADVEFECRLPNAFLADPPLEDVKTRSLELGARGFIGGLAYTLGLFNTVNRDDILFQTTGRQTGLFANVDKTRRRGLESSLAGAWENLSWRFSYSYIEASFEDDFSALSPNHDFADAEGEIQINRGDRIPGIPTNQFKLISNYRLGTAWTLGLDISSNSDQYLRGDESNQLSTIQGYTVLNLRARYRINQQFELFARIDNVLDKDYETFGLLGEEPSELDVPVLENLTVPIFLGAAAPRAAFAGFRIRF